MIQRPNIVLRQILNDIGIQNDDFIWVSNKLILRGPKKIEHMMKILSHPQYSEAHILILDDATFQLK